MKYLDPYFNSLSKNLFEGLEDFQHALNLQQFDMKTDIAQNDDSIIVKVDLPGIKKEDIELKIEDNYLTVSCENKKSEDLEKSSILISERSYGKLSRSFNLPENVATDNIKAKLEDGILTIILTKAPTNKKLITIE